LETKRKRMKALILLSLLISCPGVLACLDDSCNELLSRISLPAGFWIEYYVADVPAARGLYLSPSNILYITTSNSELYAAIDTDQDLVADRVLKIYSLPTAAHGMDFRNESLWLADRTTVYRFDNIDQVVLETETAPTPVIIRTDLPDLDGGHDRRSVRFPLETNEQDQNYLYVAIGSPCNTCLVTPPVGTISRFDVTNSSSPLESVANGVRNSVGMDWNPITSELWFTDNSRDNWGDDKPGDELNRIATIGLHYGFPYCYDKDLVDPDYNTEGNCDAYVPVEQILGPHVASLGLLFYKGSMFPNETYLYNAFIAEHGSWNRAIPIGYRISVVNINPSGTGPADENDLNNYWVFAEGWLPEGAGQGGESWGRPVDLHHMPDGSLLVSDDKNDCVYRIYYDPSKLPEFDSKDDTIIGISLIVFGVLLLAFMFIFIKLKEKPARSEKVEEENLLRYD